MAFAPAATSREFANPLAASERSVQCLASRRWLLAALVLACLLPRAVAAWKIDTLCKDGVFYVQLASAYERGDIEAGLGRLRLNTYPFILAGLHGCGLDWNLAARLWGVAVSSLVVLPLFGWVRRQFNDRAAIGACLLYAIHPKLIEWSPEAVRDPTFWLFWSGSLYATWRAVTEIQLGWFLAAGAAITLALNTRFEGWFLYLPLAWWSAWRYFALASGGGRLALGVTLATVVCPAALVAANLTFLSQQPHWELGNFGRLEYVALWYDSAMKELGFERRAPGDASVSADSTPKAIADASPAESQTIPRAGANETLGRHVGRPSRPSMAGGLEGRPTKRMSTGKMAVVLFNTLRRGIGAIFGICWLVGFFSRPRFWLRRDHIALFMVAACVAAGIWVHLWYAQATSSRYFLSIVILASGCSASGGLQAADWLGRALTRFGGSAAQRRFAWTFGLLAICTLGVGEGLYTRYPGRQRDAAIGKWLKSRLGAEQRLATSGPMELVGYYAEATAQSLPSDPASALAQLGEWQPGAAVLSRRALAPDILKQIIAGALSLGLSPVAGAHLPPGYDWTDLVVLERSGAREEALCAKPRPDLARRTD